MTGYESKRKMAADKLQEDLLNYGTAWSQDGKRIDPMSVYKEPVTEREALKLALEFVESINLGSRSASVEQQRKAIAAIKAALAQEQEPVACVQDLDEVKRKHLVYEKGMDWKDPLYTAPTPREWVGLTAEEIASIPLNEHTLQTAERLLKEKNT